MDGVHLLPARYPWLDSHTIANRDIFHLAADFDDHAGAFVAEHDGTLEHEVANMATLPVGHVATADACLLDLYTYVPLIAQLGHGAVLE